MSRNKLITIANYKMGNLRSVLNALEYLGVSAEVTDDPIKIKNAEKILLPGVGSFNQAMKNIIDLGLYDPICEVAIIKKIPVLGICLGMQLLTKSSDENGYSQGFGFIDAQVRKFQIDKDFPIPHVGFNSISLNKKNATLFDGIDDDSDFYFVHSFRVENMSAPFVSGTTNYGEQFISAFEQENVFGAQFHPEKSQSNGLKFLSNFAKL